MALLLKEMLPVLDCDTPALTEAVELADCVLLELTVLLEVREPVPVPLLEEELVGEDVGVGTAVTLAVKEILPVAEALSPSTSDGTEEELCEAVMLPVLLDVGVGVPVLLGVGLPVLVPLGVCAAVTLADREVLAVLEGEAPGEREAVGVPERETLALTVLLEVTEAVPVPEEVGVPVAVAVGVAAAVALPEKEMLPVAEALAPKDREAVGEELTEEVPEGVEVALRVGVDVGVGLALGVTVGLALAVEVEEPDTAGGMNLLGEALVELEAEREEAPLEAGDWVLAALPLRVAAEVREAAREAVEEGVAASDTEPVREEVATAVPVGSVLAEVMEDAVDVTEAEAVGLTDTSREAESTGDRVLLLVTAPAVPEGALPVRAGEVLGAALPVAGAEAVAMKEVAPEAVPVPLCAEERDGCSVAVAAALRVASPAVGVAPAVTESS